MQIKFVKLLYELFIEGPRGLVSTVKCALVCDMCKDKNQDAQQEQVGGEYNLDELSNHLCIVSPLSISSRASVPWVVSRVKIDRQVYTCQ